MVTKSGNELRKEMNESPTVVIQSRWMAQDILERHSSPGKLLADEKIAVIWPK